MGQVWRKFNLEKEASEKDNAYGQLPERQVSTATLLFRMVPSEGGVPAELRHPASRDLAGEQAIPPSQLPLSKLGQVGPWHQRISKCVSTHVSYLRYMNNKKKTNYSRIPLGEYYKS